MQNNGKVTINHLFTTFQSKQNHCKFIFRLFLLICLPNANKTWLTNIGISDYTFIHKLKHQKGIHNKVFQAFPIRRVGD